jgi:acetyltransferase-like isoleucine patch superfamily enzyme
MPCRDYDACVKYAEMTVDPLAVACDSCSFNVARKVSLLRVFSAPFRYVASFSRKWLRMTLLSFVWNRQGLRVGSNSCWHRGCFIDALGGVSIGENVIIGPNVVIHSANHRFNDLDTPIMRQGHDCAAVTIEDDCWIGANVVILPGVHVGRGCVVGAGSVVTKSLPAFSVVVGNPAVVKKFRNAKEEK